MIFKCYFVKLVCVVWVGGYFVFWEVIVWFINVVIIRIKCLCFFYDVIYWFVFNK